MNIADSVHTRTSRTKYLNKIVKLKKMVPKYFLSETIQAHENGSRGTHFAKFLISNFFIKGLTYNAVLKRFWVQFLRGRKSFGPYIYVFPCLD